MFSKGTSYAQADEPIHRGKGFSSNVELSFSGLGFDQRRMWRRWRQHKQHEQHEQQQPRYDTPGCHHHQPNQRCNLQNYIKLSEHIWDGFG